MMVHARQAGRNRAPDKDPRRTATVSLEQLQKAEADLRELIRAEQAAAADGSAQKAAAAAAEAAAAEAAAAKAAAAEAAAKAVAADAAADAAAAEKASALKAAEEQRAAKAAEKMAAAKAAEDAATAKAAEEAAAAKAAKEAAAAKAAISPAAALPHPSSAAAPVVTAPTAGAGTPAAGAAEQRPLPPLLTKTETENMERSLGHKRSPVEIGYTVYAVANIDPVSQTFAADLKVWLRWHDRHMEQDADMISLRANSCTANGTTFSKVDGLFPKEVVKCIDAEFASSSAPGLSFANAKQVEEVVDDAVVYLSPNDDVGWIRAEKHYRGEFYQMMDLHAFPFDVQELEIHIRMPSRHDLGREFKQFLKSNQQPQVEVKDWVKLSEWERYEPYAKCKSDHKGRARYTVTMPMLRRSRFYLANVLAIMSAICFLAFTSFAIPTTELGDRSGIVLTLLLTAVAFKLVISDSIPKVSYFTIMDFYMNGMFVLLFIIALENGICAALGINYPESVDGLGSHVDRNTFLSVFLLWVVFHIWFARRCRHAVADSHRSLWDSETNQPRRHVSDISQDEATQPDVASRRYEKLDA